MYSITGVFCPGLRRRSGGVINISMKLVPTALGHRVPRAVLVDSAQTNCTTAVIRLIIARLPFNGGSFGLDDLLIVILDVSLPENLLKLLLLGSVGTVAQADKCRFG
jgi:hypothetical protein